MLQNIGLALASVLAFALLWSSRESFAMADEGEKSLREELVRRVDALLSHMNQHAPSDDRTKRLNARWRRELQKLSPSHRSAGKTINKSTIFICLRNDEGNLNEVNTAMFVLLHELAHVASKSYGHTPLFWTNMRFLLHHAIESGVYQYEHYESFPKSYCGQKITGNPYACVKEKQCPLV